MRSAGCARLKAASAGPTTWLAYSGVVVTRSSPLNPSWLACTSSSSSPAFLSSSRLRWYKRSPASVSVRRRVERSSSVTPSSLSSWRILKLTTAFVCPRAAAAPVKLFASTTATNMASRDKFSIFVAPIVKKGLTVYQPKRRFSFHRERLQCPSFPEGVP
ncbi:hypothetical protein BN132_1541 [Cronobacter turicensis 564]|nr:hypothetical protein BN132_1541 [Cronobacter turicensis 564]